MKKDFVSKAKLFDRKQRMYLIQAKEHVCLHKKYFSKQSKRLRGFREIAHGRSWFHGNVDTLAHSLTGQVASFDGDKWDKRFAIMKDIYYIRKQILIESGEVAPDDYELNLCINNMLSTIVVLPTGDIILVQNRQNPSGADATTENNCIAHMIYETYIQILHYKSIPKPLNLREIACHKRGTNYLGDDRILSESTYLPGYLTFYRDNIHRVGVIVKSYVITPTCEGAEFAGFTIQRSHWNPDYYVPHYSLEKVWAGLFSKPAKDRETSLTRFMAFAFLMYPQYAEFTRIKKHVISYLQKLGGEDTHTPISFWSDEPFLRRMWTGHESEGGKNIERCLKQKSLCALEDVLKTFSIG